MSRMLIYILFFILNFSALALGGLFTGDGVVSDWYQTLNKAPWTPPGWVFGAAWTTIMIFYSLYMANAIRWNNRNQVIILYSIQWILNVSWNPIFFYFQNDTLGLIVISLLTFLMLYFILLSKNKGWLFVFLLLPYFIWLCIATSLNAYIVVFN